MKEDECYKPKFYAGKWYVHCTVTGWMGPHFDLEEDAKALCRDKNRPLHRGPKTERYDEVTGYGF